KRYIRMQFYTDGQAMINADLVEKEASGEPNQLIRYCIFSPNSNLHDHLIPIYPFQRHLVE
ncbi:hypothetical protein Leryth_013142, partial [Lithospermum erythrorhizon]